MIVVNLKQGSQEWLDYRKGKVTASNAGSIMGLNPYKSIQEYWDIFTGKFVEESNEAMFHGSNNEDRARGQFIKRTGILVKPKVIIHDDYRFLMASLDGINDNNKIIVEIKCPYKEHNFYAHCRKVPDYYYAQIQHQLFISGAETAYFYSWYEWRTALKEVTPNQQFIKEMLKRELYFYKCYIDGRIPDWSKFEKYEGILR